MVKQPHSKRKLVMERKAKIAQRKTKSHLKPRYRASDEERAILLREIGIEFEVGTTGMTVTQVPKAALTRKPVAHPKFRRVAGRKRKRGRRKASQAIAPRKPYQMERMTIVSRRGQPTIVTQVPRLIETTDTGGMVSSSWIGEIYWYTASRFAHMVLLNGYEYDVFIPFSIFKGWWWAHSKGTYFNYMIKGKFKVVRTA